MRHHNSEPADPPLRRALALELIMNRLFILAVCLLFSAHTALAQLFPGSGMMQSGLNAGAGAFDALAANPLTHKPRSTVIIKKTECGK